MSFLGDIKKEINKRYEKRQKEKEVYDTEFEKAKLKAIPIRARREGRAVGLGTRSYSSTSVLGKMHGGLVSLGNKAVADIEREKRLQRPGIKVAPVNQNTLLYGPQAVASPRIIRKKKKRRHGRPTLSLKI